MFIYFVLFSTVYLTQTQKRKEHTKSKHMKRKNCKDIKIRRAAGPGRVREQAPNETSLGLSKNGTMVMGPNPTMDSEGRSAPFVLLGPKDVSLF